MAEREQDERYVEREWRESRGEGGVVFKFLFTKIVL
jgi:hypothetical protein